jgi:selenocysteine lyase/cysteine desulfurase
MAGLVNFAVSGLTPQTVAEQLHARFNLTIRYVDYRPCPLGARAACAWWNTEDEVDRLVAAVAAIAQTVG